MKLARPSLPCLKVFPIAHFSDPAHIAMRGDINRESGKIILYRSYTLNCEAFGAYPYPIIGKCLITLSK